MRGRAAGAAALVLALAALAPMAALAAPKLTLTPNMVEAGEDVTVEGTGFEPGSTFQLYIDEIGRRTFLGAATADSGSFIEVVTIPGATSEGTHTVLACERDVSGVCRVRASAKLEVVPAAGTPTPTPSRTPTTSTQPPGSPTPPGSSPTPSPTLVGPPQPTKTAATPGPQFGSDAQPTDVFASAIEVTQGIQDMKNRMPLIPLRPTFARVYFGADKPVFGVRGILGAFDGGMFLGSVSALNQPLCRPAACSDPAGPTLARKDIAFALLFRIPAGWTTRGKITLTAFVYAGDLDTVFEQETNSDNNFRSTTVTFGSKAILYRVVLVPIHVHEADGQDVTWIPATYPKTTASILAGTERLVPVSMALPLHLPFILYPAGHEEGNEFDLNETSGREPYDNEKPLTELSLWKSQSGPLVSTYQWYGMLWDITAKTYDWNVDLKLKVAWQGKSNGDVSMGQMVSSYDDDRAFELYGSSIMAHEWGHDLGLSHVACVGTGDRRVPTSEQKGGGIDANFPTPWPDCSLAIVDTQGFYGLDVMYDRISIKSPPPFPSVIGNDPAFPTGQRAFPVMSYANDKYLDPYAACKMLNFLGVDCDAYPPPPPGTPGVPGPDEIQGLRPVSAVAAQPASSARLLVSGFATESGSAGSLFTVGVLEEVSDAARAASGERLARVNPSAPVALILEDASGGQIARYPLVRDGVAPDEQPGAGFSFVEWLPVPAGLRRVVLRGPGGVLASATASAARPVVEIIAPAGGSSLDGPFEIRWRGADPDGDALTYDVLASPDAGATWRLVARGLTGTSVRLDSNQIGKSDRTRFRIRAHDGFNTGSADTRDLRVANAAPNLVLIMSPVDGATFRTADLVVLNGRATDLEDELVEELSWSSDVDGPLGSGAEVTLRTLSPGAHVITLRATDRNGATAEQRVSITVDAGRRADVPDAATIARVEKLLAERFGERSFPWPVAIAGAALAAIAAGALVSRREAAKGSKRRRPGGANS